MDTSADTPHSLRSEGTTSASGYDAAPPAKRQRLRGPVGVPRRRAPTACNFCRSRKTKCNNAHPACGTCVYNRVECVYQETAEEQNTFDPASQTILDRLDELKELLLAPGGGAHLARENPDLKTPSASGVHIGDISFTKVPDSGTIDLPNTASERPGYPDAANVNYSCEAVLRWPIFRGLLPSEDATIKSFLLDSQVDFDNTGSSSPHRRLSGARADGQRAAVSRGIQEEAFIPLCKKFLALVHPKNPILNESDLLEYAKEAAEHGLGWNGTSCLVLIACALACLATKWQPPRNTPDDQGLTEPPDVSAEDVATAETYFLAARKRIGLLQSSIVDIQCFFIASIYEKCAVRPLRAWQNLQQAALRLQAHLARKARRRYTLQNGESRRIHLLEQRLFWSCVKAEFEFLPCIPLRPSGVEHFAYPDMFPSPPVSKSTPTAEGDTPAHTDDSIDGPEEHQSWFFYLAEISMRRTINDMQRTLYREGERQWTSNLGLLLRQYDECKQQVNLWFSHLPEPIQFDDSKWPRSELSFFLQGRFAEWNELIARPLVYYVLHSPPRAHDPDMSRAISIAQQSVSMTSDGIIRLAHHHRHGGTWFVCRSQLCISLIILAAALSDGRIQPPENWPSAIRVAHRTLAKWAPEADDVEWMRSVLHRLFHKVCQKIGLRIPDDYLH